LHRVGANKPPERAGEEKMETRDIITLINLIVTIIGGGAASIFAIIQWRKSNKIRQAEFINQLITKIRSDKDIAKTIYMIEYDKTWYNDKFDNGSEKEMEIDSLFSFLTYICYLYDTKNIHYEEFRIFEYEIKRVCSNKQTQEYLKFLYHWSKQQNASCSFQNLVDYLRNKVLSPEEKIQFDNNDSKVNG
jgi:hypothetical protein